MYLLVFILSQKKKSFYYFLIYVKSIEASLTNVGYFYKKYHIYFNTHLCELRKSIIP